MPTQTFTDIQTADIIPTTLANYDTVFMYGYDPNQMSAQQKADLVAWVYNGGKLIICPGEDAFYGTTWDYTWLPEPIVLSVPGAMGASGTLTIAEDSVLTQDGSGNPIDVNYLGTQTDAVGDADVLTIQGSGWCAALIATNYAKITGPAEMYDQYGQGVIIFNGLDWDYAGYGADPELVQLMKNMFDVSTLTCGAPWTGNLDVTKEANEVECLGDTITFTVTVTNNQPVGVTNVQWTDTPPAEITMSTTSGSLSDLAASGGYTEFTITATADAIGTGLVNEILVTGDGPGGAPFSGTASWTFDIEQCVIPVAFDLKPGSCPNSYNRGDKGVVPAAILGTSDFDVNEIDTSTLYLEGVSPLRYAYEDVGAPLDCGGPCTLCACWEGLPDGYLDLTVKFDSQDIAAIADIAAATKGDYVPLTITGALLDGTEITGEDCLRIVK